ncbi:MAG TPA: FHA domain-containing protein [Kofleriaceae bacterium]|nr:FHA domain-containing protein [Kofleriaceae bacterium]
MDGRRSSTPRPPWEEERTTVDEPGSRMSPWDEYATTRRDDDVVASAPAPRGGRQRQVRPTAKVPARKPALRSRRAPAPRDKLPGIRPASTPLLRDVPRPVVTRAPARAIPPPVVASDFDPLSTVEDPTLDEGRPPHAEPPALAPLPPVAAADPAQARARLCIVAGPSRGQIFELTGRPVTIGRAMANDIVLTDIAASRRHVKIALRGALYEVRDLGSGNGTLINDVLESGAVTLRDGDRLELGNTVLRFDHPGSKPLAVRAPTAVPDGSGDDDEEESTLSGPTNPDGGAALAAVRAMRRKGPGLPGPNSAASMVLPSVPPGGSVAAQTPSALALPAPLPTAVDPDPPSAEIFEITAEPPPLPGPRAGARRNRFGPTFIPTGSFQAPDYGQLLIAPARRQIPRRALLVAGLVIVAGLGVTGLAMAFSGDDEPARHGGMAALVAEADGAGPAESDSAAEVEDPHDPGMVPPRRVGQANAGKNEVKALAATPSAPLPLSTWGTDETILAALSQAQKPQPEPAPAPALRPAPRPRPKKPPHAAPHPASKTNNSTIIRRAESRASAAYQRRALAEAADIASAAARQTDGRDSRHFRTLAQRYNDLDKNLKSGSKNRFSNAPAAMRSFSRALSIDRQLGGAHASYIRAQLGTAAPKAAAAYMVQHRYDKAYAATVVASRYGGANNAMVRQVSRALASKAAGLYRQASVLRRSDPQKARKLLSEAMSMVPKSSDTYKKSSQLRGIL